jgi:hypothetical protein
MSDLREALEAAMDQPNTAADDVTTEVVEEPSSIPEGGGLEPASTSASSAAPQNEDPPVDLNTLSETGEISGSEGRKRGPDGKFAPKEAKIEQKQAENQPLATENQGIAPAPKAGEPPKPYDKAPISWRPEVREEWDKLPESVKQTVATRERQVQQVLNESAEARKFTEVINRTIAPYQAMLQAENMHPVQMVGDLLQTAQALRTSPPASKAELVATIITKFGIDIPMLDRALSGQQPHSDPVQAQVEQMLQQQLAPIQQEFQQLRQQRDYQTQQVQYQAAQTVDQFIESVPYGRDVAPMMADLIDMAEARGQSMSLEQAYEAACYADPGIRGLMQRQQQQGNLQARAQAAAKAKGVAVSVTGSPGASDGNAQQADSVRDAIVNAIANNSR